MKRERGYKGNGNGKWRFLSIIQGRPTESTSRFDSQGDLPNVNEDFFFYINKRKNGKEILRLKFKNYISLGSKRVMFRVSVLFRRFLRIKL